MEHKYQKPSDVIDEMPCPLDLSMSTNQYGTSKWTFWSSRPNDELEYQCNTMSEFDHPDAAPVVPSYTGIYRVMIKSIFQRNPYNGFCFIQFWAPLKVNGLTFLSTADQPFALTNILDKRLCSYRKLCLHTLIPIDINDANGESHLGPPGRVFIRGFPEYSSNIQSYSTVEFPLLQHAIQLGIQSYYAVPVFKLHENHCLGVFEIASTYKYYFEHFVEMLELGSYGLYIPCWAKEILSKLSEPWKLALGQIKAGLDVVTKRHSSPVAQIWIPDPQSSSIKALIATGEKIHSRLTYLDFAYVSKYCYIQRGKAVVGRAFSSQGSCFCKDVTLLSLTEYPLVLSAQKARLTLCFAICLRSKCANDFVCVVECFWRPNKMVNRDPQTFLNMLLSTMKEQLPGFIVASGKELGQRMRVEVVKVSRRDKLDSFEIGQSLPSVQSLQDGGETTEIDSLRQQSNFQYVENNVTTEQLVPCYSFEIGQLLPSFQSLHDGGKTIEIDPSLHQPNLQNGESNIATAPVVPSCSSHKRDAFNNKEPVEVDLSPQHPTEDAVTNRRRAGVDVAHEYTEIEKDTSEMMQPGLHIELPNVEIDSRGKARINDKPEHKEKTIQRIVKDHGITREILEQHFGMERKDAAKALHVSVSTLKRVCREYDISRWPHHKTRKVNHHATKAAALQGVEPYMEDQERPNLSQENGTDCLAHKRSPATSKPCDTVITLKVKYRDHTIKFKLTPESTRVELQREVEKRLKISLQKFSIKYQDEDDEWITIATDSDLRDGMEELRSLKRTHMRLLVTPNPDA